MEKKSLTLVHVEEASLDAVELAYRTLHSDVLDGRLPPGRLLSQVTLAGELGISRNPLREMLRRLPSEGLVVGDFNQRLRAIALDLKDFDGMYASRIALESIDILATVTFLEKDHKRLLAKHVDVMDQSMAAPDLPSFLSHHRAF